jgi:hypothetical protein
MPVFGRRDAAVLLCLGLYFWAPYCWWARLSWFFFVSLDTSRSTG